MKTMQNSKVFDIQWGRTAECCGGLFFLLNTPKEVNELPAEDTRFYKRCEIEAELNLEFTDHREGIYLAMHDTLPNGIDEIFLDLSTELISICVFGNYAGVRRLLQMIASLSKPGIVTFNNDILYEFADSFQRIESFNYEFIRDGAFHTPRSRFSGNAEGNEAQEYFQLVRQKYPWLHCLKKITGFSDLSSISALTLIHNGFFYIRDIDPQSLMFNFEKIKNTISNKFERMIGHVFSEEEGTSGEYTQVNGTGLIYMIPPQSSDIMNFCEKLSKSKNVLNSQIYLLKSFRFERLYRIISYDTGAGLEMTVSPNAVQINMYSPMSIILALRVEYFMQKHLNADMKLL